MQNNSHAFGKNPDSSLGTQLKIQLLESSLSKLFECLARECSCRKLVHPQWKHFKAMKLAWEDRIRLNNALWRCWHIQYLKGKRPKFCGYVTPLTGESHSRSRAVVLEGKYWRRRLEAVANEYKDWRIFYKDRQVKQAPLKSSEEYMDKSSVRPAAVAASPFVGFMPGRIGASALHQSEFSLPSALDEQDLQLLSSYSDTLFSSLVQYGHQPRLDDYSGFADVMQPRLNMVQHNFGDLINSLDPSASLDGNGAMNSVLPSDSLWKESTPSPTVTPALPMAGLPMDQSPLQSRLDSSSAAVQASASGGGGGGMGDATSTDAHMAAQQLIMLMSSGKDGDPGPLKQLQMLLQSAANATPPSMVAGGGGGGGGGTAMMSASAAHQPMQVATHSNSTPAALSSSTPMRLSPPHLSMPTNSGESMSSAPRSAATPYESLSSQIPPPLAAPNSQASMAAGGAAMMSPVVSHSSSYLSAGNTSSFDSSAMGMAEQQLKSPTCISIKSERGSGGQIVGKEERRKLHITAEQKRRVHIRNGFEELQALVPSVSAQSTKISKAVLLQKSVDHMRHMQQEKRNSDDEMERLRAEITQLNENIMQCQEQLPVTGAPITRTRLDQTQQLFDQYVNVRTQANFKFWIFSMIVRSLFEAYNHSVSTASEDEMCRSVLTWFDHHCSLRALRPAVLSALRQLSTSTSILNDSAKLPTEATSAAAAAAGATNLKSANAAAAAAANAATVAALASTFQNPFRPTLQSPQEQQQQQQQEQQSALLAQAMQSQQANQPQLQSQVQQQMSYFADGGLSLPILNRPFR